MFSKGCMSPQAAGCSLKAAMSPQAAGCSLKAACVVAGCSLKAACVVAGCSLNAACVAAEEVSSCGTFGFYVCILSEAAAG